MVLSGRKLIVQGFVLSVLPLMLSACGENQPGKIASDTLKVKAPVMQLPAHFPLPAYPQATSSNPFGEMYKTDLCSVQLVTGDSSDRVASYYQKHMQLNGWLVENSIKIGSSYNISATKNGMRANISIQADGTETSVSLAITQQG